MAYTYDPIFAFDPNNPANIARSASITIFDPADTTKAPITLTDPTGVPLPNPITVDAQGMGPAFQHPTLARVGWTGAGLTNYLTSYEGMFNETTAAKAAAQSAANDAASAAADRVTAATVNGSGKLILTKGTGATVDAGSVIGPKGDKGDKGLDGANVLPTSEAITQALTTEGPAKAALSAAAAAAAAPKLGRLEALAGKLSPIAGSNQWASVGASPTSNTHNSIQPFVAADSMTHVAPAYMFGGFTQEYNPSGIAADITVRAAVEYPEGTIRPLFFNGSRSVKLEPGAVIVGDPLAHDIPKGALFFIRTYVTKAATGNFIFNHQSGTFSTTGTSFTTSRAGGALDGGETGTDLTDKSMSGAIPTTAGIPTYAPWAVFGQSETARIAVMLEGDSITRGQGAAGNIGSWAHQALNITEANASRATKLLTKYGWISSATSGETIANLLNIHGMRLALLRHCTHALGMMGTNDLGASRTAAQIKADLTALWKINAQCGVKSYFGTIVPQATSTDGWTTLANQTAGHQVARADINGWMRDGAPLDPATLLPVAVGTAGAVRAAYHDGATVTPASGPSAHPLTAAFELADAVESSRDSGKWRVDQGAMTTDGTHPNPAAYKLMGAKAAPVVATWTL